jgi:hypothetical protein
MNSKPHTPYLVGAVVTAVLAVGLLLVGGALLWADGEKDADGYLTTDSHTFATPTRALASENLDVDLGGAREVLDSSVFGKVRLKVASQDDKPVFVGIARTRDVDAYLRGVSHATVTDVDYSPFTADYRNAAGTGRAAAPATQQIWEASSTGSGTQTLSWEVEDGDWSVVVMNADGSRGVHADVTAGASMPFLTAGGWTAIGGGLLLVLATAGLVALAMRPRYESPGTVAPQPAG